MSARFRSSSGADEKGILSDRQQAQEADKTAEQQRQCEVINQGFKRKHGWLGALVEKRRPSEQNMLLTMLKGCQQHGVAPVFLAHVAALPHCNKTLC